MTVIDSLDDLYRPAIRKTKGKVAKAERPSPFYSSRRQLVTLNSYHKAWGVVRRSPEVMVKFGPCNIRNFEHIKKATDYISRNGKLTLEDSDGNEYEGKKEYSELLKDWKTQNDIPENDDHYGHARRIILSMPFGTDVDKFKKACRTWAKDCLEGYDYLVAFHFAETDHRTKNPHCHILLNTMGKDHKRFHISNEEREIMREHFAACLGFYGIRANCTRRAVRGKTVKGLSQTEYHAHKRFLSNKERAKLYAMDKKRKKKSGLTDNMERRQQRVSEAIRNNQTIPDHEAIKRAKKTREEITTKTENILRELEQTNNITHHNLAHKMKEFYNRLEPVESREQRAVRLVREKTQSVRLDQTKKQEQPSR